MKAVRPHFADDEAEAWRGKGAGPRPPGLVAIQSLWIFRIPELPRSSTSKSAQLSIPDTR